MAQPETVKFGKFIVKVSNGAEPAVFTAPCGFTSKSLTLGKNLNEIVIPDCNDPDLPIGVNRDVVSSTASVSGEGVLAAQSVPEWLAFFQSDEGREVRIEIPFSTGMLTYTGRMHLETWTIGAERGNRVTSNISLQSDGEMEIEWTASAG